MSAADLSDALARSRATHADLVELRERRQDLVERVEQLKEDCRILRLRMEALWGLPPRRPELTLIEGGEHV